MTRERENYSMELYKDVDNKWRWRMKDKRNGEIVGASHEGFTDLKTCEHNFWINTGWSA